MPERHVEEDREQRLHSGLFHKRAPQPRRLQHAAMLANQLCDLDEVTHEKHRQEVGFVDDLVKPERFRLVEIRPVEEVDHFGDDRAGEIAGRSQFQASPDGRAANQQQRVAGDCGGIEFVKGQVAGEAEGPVRRRRFVAKRIEALERVNSTRARRRPSSDGVSCQQGSQARSCVACRH